MDSLHSLKSVHVAPVSRHWRFILLTFSMYHGPGTVLGSQYTNLEQLSVCSMDAQSFTEGILDNLQVWSREKTLLKSAQLWVSGREKKHTHRKGSISNSQDALQKRLVLPTGKIKYAYQ